MAATRAATHRWHQNSEESKGQICHVLPVTNVTSLGEHKKFGAPFCYSRLAVQTSVRFSPTAGEAAVMDGKWLVKKVWSIFTLPRAPGRRYVLKTGAIRGENLSSLSLSYHASLKKKKNKRQRYNHALTDTLEREKDCSPERSLLSECLIHLALAENRHFNMTSRYIRVSLSTGIHATTMQRGVVAALKVERNFATRFTWSDPKWSKVGSQHQKTVVVHWETPSCKCEKVSKFEEGSCRKKEPACSAKPLPG